jgi:hypothetical protein
LLLARRLVEGGVRFVTVTSGGWDTHNNAFNALKNRLPSFDRALSALLGDLAQRGLLQKTLVVVMGEFGRTPKITATAAATTIRAAFPLCWPAAAFGAARYRRVRRARGRTAERPVKPKTCRLPSISASALTHAKHLSPEGVRVTLSRGGRRLNRRWAERSLSNRILA